MNTFLANTTRAAIILSVTGFAIGVPGCNLSPERRIEIIREESDHAEARAERIRKKGIRQCRGDAACEQRVQDEYAEAMRLIQKIRDRRIDGELVNSQESEDEWEQWFQDLTDPAKKLWEPLVDFIRKLLDKEAKSEGTLYTTSLRVLTTPEDSGPQGDQAEPLTAADAVGVASSVLMEPGSWEQAYRLQISGTVAMEIREGTATTLSNAVISLTGIYDGQLNPSETIGLTGGTVSLFGGEVTVRLSTAVGASRLQIHSNGNGFLQIAGYTDHADEWNDTDMTDRIRIKIPVQLVGQTLVVSSDGEFIPGHIYFHQPDNLIADYDNDGYVNAFDVSAFLADFNAADDYADINGDGVVDQADFDPFMEEYNRSVAWSQFWTNWATQ